MWHIRGDEGYGRRKMLGCGYEVMEKEPAVSNRVAREGLGKNLE